MSRIPPTFNRPTSLTTSDTLLSHLQRTQRQLMQTQQQVSTGLRYNAPSDAPDKTSAILYLRQQLAANEQYAGNLGHAGGMLNTIDAALGEASNIMLEARDVAMGQIGVASDAGTREASAMIIDEQLRAMMQLGNRQYQNIALFGGSGGAGGAVFEEFLGGVRYTGTLDSLKIDGGGAGGQSFTSTGVSGFGALSSRVVSQVDLAPQASADTKLSEVSGAQGQGIRRGPMTIDVNGTTATVDLTHAETLGDVRTRLNAAINAIDPTAGSVALSGEGFELTANTGFTITLDELGSGQTAADLGLTLSAAAGSAAGTGVGPRLTDLTQLSDLGAGVDWAGGLRIEQGGTVKVADFSSDATIQDMKNTIKSLNMGLRLEINSAGDGLNIISEVSGIAMSIGENGGTTAQDLGLRTFDRTTALTDFRHGLGVETQAGEDDLEITLQDGRSFRVNLDGAATVSDVIDAVEIAASSAGIALGGEFSVQLASTGNGMTFTDNTVGGDIFRIENVGQSLAGDHLGITGSAESGNTITGSDVAKVKVDSAFTHLIELREALLNDDSRGITLAGSGMEDDLDRLVRARAHAGVEARRVQDAAARLEDQQVMEKSMLSNLQDADLSEVITRFAQLQQQLQASLQVGSRNMGMSLLDFLR